MGVRTITNQVVFAMGMILTFALAHFSSSAQEPTPKFGSSLDGGKWSEKKKETEVREKTRSSGANGIVRVETNLAVFDVQVLDKQGQIVDGLTKDDFAIAEDRKPQEVAMFSLNDGSTSPRSIVLIIDYSFSQLPYIENSITAAKTLVDNLKPKDRLAIVTDDVALLTDFTSDKVKLKESLDSLLKFSRSGRLGHSAQYSALLATLREIVNDEEHPIIIFQTDGDELGLLQRQPSKFLPSSWIPDKEILATILRDHLPRKYGIEDIYKTAEKSRVTIYTIIPGIRFIDVPEDQRLSRAMRVDELHRQARLMNKESPLPPADNAGLIWTANSKSRQQLALTKLSRLTSGGVDYLEEPGQAARIYDAVFSKIEHRYIVSYYPTNEKRDGTMRKVDIQVRNHPEYTVWGKKSYYARSQ